MSLDSSFLFRSNAIRSLANLHTNTFEQHNPSSSLMSLNLKKKTRHENWLLKRYLSDNVLLNQTCSNFKTPKMVSSFWRTPESTSFLTSIAAHDVDAVVAVGSGNDSSNLLIYEVDPVSLLLTHHKTITAPGITTMKWVSTSDSEISNILATGHKQGIVQFISIPDNNSKDSAKIKMRFNHKRHLSYASRACSRVKNLNLANSNWKSCPKSSIVTLCNDDIFLWDPNRNDIPLLKLNIKGANDFNISPLRDGLVSIAGDGFGISLFDLRSNEPQFFKSKRLDSNSNAEKVTWSNFDENLLVSSHNDHYSIKVWDIRACDYFNVLNGHCDSINSLKFSENENLNGNELYSGSSDGTIVRWDLNNCNNNYNYNDNDDILNVNHTIDDIFYEKKNYQNDYRKQVNYYNGEIISSTLNIISDLEIGKNGILKDKLLSCDGDTFIGLHSKTNTNVETYQSNTDSSSISDYNQSVVLGKISNYSHDNISSEGQRSRISSYDYSDLFSKASSSVSGSPSTIASSTFDNYRDPSDLEEYHRKSDFENINNNNNGSTGTFSTIDRIIINDITKLMTKGDCNVGHIQLPPPPPPQQQQQQHINDCDNYKGFPVVVMHSRVLVGPKTSVCQNNY